MSVLDQLLAENYIDLGVTGTAAHTEGRLFYDPNEHALVVYNDETSTVQKLGQDSFLRVYNNSGSTIAIGKPVYMSGVEGVENRATVGLALANTSATARVLGLTSHAILNNSFGYVTKAGSIKNINTNAYAAGDPLYLDEVTPGAFRITPPSDGNYVVFMGCISYVHATLGAVLVTNTGTDSATAPSMESTGSLKFADEITPATNDLAADTWAKVTAFDTKVESGANYILGDVLTNFRLTTGSLGAGKYVANFQVSGVTNATGVISFAIYKNGVLVETTIATSSYGNNASFSLAAGDDFTLVDTDYLELWVRVSSATIDPDINIVALTLNRISGGQRGLDGSIGPAGVDGDITWEGSWVSQEYLQNQAVYYIPAGQSYVCHTSTTASQIPTDTGYWDILAKKGTDGASGADSMRIGYPEGSASTNATSYAVVGRIAFEGSIIAGTPTEIKTIIHRTGGTSGSIRIYDVTNALVIAELTGFIETSPTNKDLGTISNVPTGEAIFEIQMLRTGGGGSTTVEIDFFKMGF